MLLNALRKICVHFSFLQSRNTKLVSLNVGEIASNEHPAKMYLSNILCYILQFLLPLLKGFDIQILILYLDISVST